MTQVCKVCLIEKPRGMFEPHRSKRGFRKTCRKCRSKRPRNRLNDIANRERSRYGITKAEIGPNICMICGSVNRICIDHCHDTGRVRGLLCTKCNTGLGMLGDNVVLLRLAVKYLETFLEKSHGR